MRVVKDATEGWSDRVTCPYCGSELDIDRDDLWLQPSYSDGPSYVPSYLYVTCPPCRNQVVVPDHANRWLTDYVRRRRSNVDGY